jgi:hypothetical protein
MAWHNGWQMIQEPMLVLTVMIQEPMLVLTVMIQDPMLVKVFEFFLFYFVFIWLQAPLLLETKNEIA